MEEQWSRVVPNTSWDDRDIRNGNPTSSLALKDVKPCMKAFVCHESSGSLFSSGPTTDLRHAVHLSEAIQRYWPGGCLCGLVWIPPSPCLTMTIWLVMYRCLCDCGDTPHFHFVGSSFLTVIPFLGPIFLAAHSRLDFTWRTAWVGIAEQAIFWCQWERRSLLRYACPESVEFILQTAPRRSFFCTVRN
jgi:hypothetical protein